MRTTFSFDLQGANQATEDRKIQPGEHVEIINMRRPKAGALVKRTGLQRETIETFSTGATYTGPATALECANVELVRDSLDQLWVRNGDTAIYRGRHQRAWPTTTGLPQHLPSEGAQKPQGVLHDGLWWQFSCGKTAPTGIGNFGYQLTVIDPVTKVIVLDSGPILVGGVGGCAAIALDDGVRLFWFEDSSGSNRGRIYCDFFATVTATPVRTTYATVADAEITSIDCDLLSTDGRVMVAATSYKLGAGPPYATSKLWWSVLNTGTNLAADSDSVSTDTASFADHRTCNGVGILKKSNTEAYADDGFARLTYFRPLDGADQTELIRVRVDLSDLTLDAETVIKTYDNGFDQFEGQGVSGGYRSTPTEVYYATMIGMNEVYYSEDSAETPHGPSFSSAITHRITVPDVGVITVDTWARSACLASKPFKYGSDWYVLTHFNDGRAVQRGYWLRTAAGIPLVVLLDGYAASPLFGGGLDTDGVNGFEYKAYSGHHVTVAVSGDTLYAPLLTEFLSSRTFQPVLVSIDMAASYHSTATDIIPGGIPAVAGASDTLIELTPLHFPYEPIRNLEDDAPTTPLATVQMTYRYAFIDSAGRQYLSAPYPTQEFEFFNISGGDGSVPIALPCCRHTLTSNFEAGQLSILLYSSVPGGTTPYLQLVVANKATSDYAEVVIKPATFNAAGEILDTIGVSQGVLDQAAVPAFRLVTQGKDRVWGIGPDDSIWFSQRSRAGRGPEFSEALTTEWADGSGPITAIAPINGQDAIAVFRQDAVGIISGPGPNGIGGEAVFQVVTLPTKGGTDNPYGVVTGPLGVYYTRAADGRVALIPGVSPPVEIHQGMDDYSDYQPLASLHIESERLVRWFCADGDEGRILSLDDGWKGEGSPAGKWIMDRKSNGGWPLFVGVRLINGLPVVLLPGISDEIHLLTGYDGYDDELEPVLTKQTFGRMSPTGFQGEFDVLECQISSTLEGGDSIYTYTLQRDTGETEAHTDVTNTTADVKFWSGIDRTRDVRLTIEETDATGAGRKFDGVLFEINAYGRPQNPRRRIQ